ncbi:unnamed protein product, partial [Medioppia subpectinata]
TKKSVQLLSLCFGFGSWIAIAGLWLEIPVLIQRLPEKWTLASDMNMVIQLANVGPVLYFFLRKYKLCDETIASHALLFVGLVSCLLLITCWDKTLVVFGRERSVVLFAATFGLALLDCTSSLTFLPFMARFETKYLTPFLIGEGLSGFIPTLFALLQGVEQNECENAMNSESNLRFSAKFFFSSLLLTLIISWISLVLLQSLPDCRHETRRQTPQDVDNKNTIGNRKYKYLLSVIGFSCFSTFGVMPSIQPFSALPFGNSCLHFVVIFSALCFPFGCFLAMIYQKRKSVCFVNYLTLFAHLIAVYIIITAILSPNPPLIQFPTFGSIFTTICWIFFTTIVSYVKTIITLIISDSKGNEGLFWIGFQTQFGSLFGALFMFLIINHSNVF